MSQPSPGLAPRPLHPCQLPIETLLSDCEVSFRRGSGPGGQHRNKTESAVLIRHTPSGVLGQASERRSQAENLAQATKRLRVNLALEVRCPELGESAPTALWNQRCQHSRILINPEHADFPALLAEALDVLILKHAELPPAAAQLCCTASQLRKLVRLEPRAWDCFNAWRRQRGLDVLH